MADVQIIGQADEIIRKLKSLSKKFDKKGQQRLLKKGAKIIQKSIKANSPTSGDTHYRYQTSKLNKNKRAAKGSGNIVAAYDPGNFKRAIKTMLFRRSSGVFVGPRIAKGNRTGTFSGNKVDGYYAHMVERGTVNYSGLHPIRTGFESSKAAAGKAIELEGKKLLTEFKRSNEI